MSLNPKNITPANLPPGIIKAPEISSRIVSRPVRDLSGLAFAEYAP